MVVLDEIHAYRGIFGSHVANVVRRLLRVAAHYGARPLVISSSATIGNASEHASRLCGRPVSAIQADGAPRGRKWVAFWNPAPIDVTGMSRRSANLEAAAHLAALVARGVPAIAFTKSRVAAELVYRYTHERLAERCGGLAERLVAYRAGYLPAERRAIERRLFAGETVDAGRYPKLARFLRRALARPAFQKALQAEIPAARSVGALDMRVFEDCAARGGDDIAA